MKNKFFNEMNIYIGREKEINQFYKIVGEAQHFETGALVNLWGVKGIGKTAFLRQVCRKNEHVINGRTVVFISSYINLENLKTRDEIRENIIASFISTGKTLDNLRNNITSIEQMASSAMMIDTPIEETFIPYTSYGTLVFVFDDFHILENSDPKLAQYFLDEIALPLLRSTKAIIILAGNYSLGKNPNIDEDQKIKINKIPSSIKLEGLNLNETRLFLQSQIPSAINNREDLVDLIFTYTAGHPFLILLAMHYIKDSKYVPESWVEVKEEFQRIVLGELPDKKIYNLRMQCLPALKKLSIFRTFSAGLLEDAKILFNGFEGLPAHQLINLFLRANLIMYDSAKGGYVIDPTIRQLVENWLFWDNLDLWKSTHLSGFDLYYNLICEYPVKPDAYLLEFIYHAFNLLKVDTTFGDIFVDRLEKLRVTLDGKLFLQLAQNDLQIQFLVKNTSVGPYLKSLQNWVLNPGKGQQKMAHNIVFVKPDRLIGKVRNARFEQILTRIKEAQSASILIEGGGGIGKSDILRRIVETATDKKNGQSLIIPDKDKGIIDLAIPINRDPIHIMNWIAEGIRNRFAGSFEGFVKAYDNYRKGSIYSRLLLSNDTSISDLLPIWIEEYNKVVDDYHCKILVAFDTVEKLHEDSLFNELLGYILLGERGLKNTIIVVAGRSIKKKLEFTLKRYDKNFVQIKLEPLDDDDTREYIQGMSNKEKTFIDKKDEKTYFSLSQGYPVIISLLVSLSEADPAILGNIEQDSEVSNALAANTVDRNDPETLSVIFQKICSQYVKFIREQEENRIKVDDVYNLIIQVRRGLDGNLLSYLEEGNRSDQECQDEIARWRDLFKPLIKEIPSSFSNDDGRSFYVVAHDVIFEYANPVLPPLDKVNVLKRVVDYYRLRRRDFFRDPRLVVDKPEIYLSILQDRIFYEFTLNPWKSLCVLSQEIRDAYRQGELLLMKRLWEEWNLLIDDKTFDRSGLVLPAPEIYELEKKLLKCRERILKGDLGGLVEDMQLLVNSINEIAETQIPNDDAKKFLDDLKGAVAVELERINILDGSFSDSLSFEKSLGALDQLIITPLSDKNILADAYSARGLYWTQVMRYDKAYKEFLLAFPIYRDLNAHPDMCRCQSQLSLLSILQGQFSKAEQHYLLANELAVNLSKDSLVVSLVERNLAHLYLANGNLQRAGRIYENLFKEFNYLQNEKESSSEGHTKILKDRPSYEQTLHWLSFIENKSIEIAFSLILKDLLSSYSGNQIDIIEDYFTKIKIPWDSQITRFDLEYARSEFYLYYLTCLRLIPEISIGQRQRSHFLEKIKQSLSLMGGVEQDENRVFGWRLLKYCFIQSANSFILDDFYTAKLWNVKAQEEISRTRNALSEEKRRNSQPGFSNLGELFTEFYSLEGRVFLLTGHLLLTGDVEKRKALSSALSYYGLALQQLLLHPNKMHLIFAYEEIRFYLLKLFEDEKSFYSEFNAALSGMQLSVGIQYLKENLPLRSGVLY